MVVDDDPSIVDAVKTVLEDRDYEVIPAFSGEGALKEFNKHGIDIAFFDIKMPNMDGIELLRNVKKKDPKTYTIMMTAYASVDNAVEAMKEGANDYIRKPFEMKDIKTTILGALEDLEFKRWHDALQIPRGMKEKNPFETFMNLLREGKSGICISAKNPETLNEKYELGDTEHIWLSEDGEEGLQLSPQKLDHLGGAITKFASDHEDSAILIDSLDYLLEKNSLESLEEFISGVEEELSSWNASLILSGDPKNMDENDLEELEYLISDIPARVVSDSLSSYIRRKIISQLNKEGGISFTTLAKRTGITDSAKISFHLRKLESWKLIKKDEEKRYYLTALGENTAKTLEQIRGLQETGLGKVTWMPR